MKNFLWKTGNNILPTRKKLFQKQVIDDPIWLIFQRDEETIVHALWDCPTAGDVWVVDTDPLQKWSIKEIYFLHLWEKLIYRLQ